MASETRSLRGTHGQRGPKRREKNRTITVDFHDESNYFQLICDGTAFVEFVLAFVLSIGFQLAHKATVAAAAV